MYMYVLVPPYSVVREYTNEVGPLPLSANGKPLQEVLSSSPRLQFVGSKPSSIYLTLVNTPTSAPEKTVPVPPVPRKGMGPTLCENKYKY